MVDIAFAVVKVGYFSMLLTTAKVRGLSIKQQASPLPKINSVIAS